MNEENPLPGSYDDFEYMKIPRHSFRFKRLLKTLIDGTIAHNDMHQLMHLVLDREVFQFVSAAMISLDQTENNRIPPQVYLSNVLDHNAELEMLTTYFMQNEICLADMIRLFHIIVFDNEAYRSCQMSREFRNLWFLRDYFEGREGRRN